jgi:hypothetical protein
MAPACHQRSMCAPLYAEAAVTPAMAIEYQVATNSGLSSGHVIA